MNIVVIGLGYVGLPLLLALVNSGKRVIGYDINGEIINDLNNGRCHLDLWSEKVKKELRVNENVFFTSDLRSISKIDAAIICVPTPLDLDGNADHSFVDSALMALSEQDLAPKLIIVESTVAPGYTRAASQKYFGSRLVTCGGDIHICFSPEREDPGNKNFTNTEIPKVISGLSQECLELGVNLYMSVFSHVLKASSLEAAELCKLHENTFRAVNISYVNQMRNYSSCLGINFDEVITLAKSKPFGFMDFHPGIGVGGHCIPVDPYFLLNNASELGISLPVVETAMAEINKGPKSTCDWLLDQNISGCDVLLTGIAYKDGVSDTRCSPAIELFKLLSKSCRLHYWDPNVSKIKIADEWHKSVSDDQFSYFQGVIVVINNSGWNFVSQKKIQASKVFDARYRMKDVG